MRLTLMVVLLSALVTCNECPMRDRAEAGTSTTIADVAEMSSRGVVNISSSRLVSFDPRDSRFERDLLSRFFFGVPDEPEQTIEQSQGSAVIVSSDGFALTNHHRTSSLRRLRHAAPGRGSSSRSETYDRSNPVRTETAEQAQAIDVRIACAWSAHPRRFLVENQTEFVEKLARTIALIRDQVPHYCRSDSIPELERR